MLGWRTERAKRWLRREGAAVKKGAHWYTTDRLLVRHFPEAFEHLVLEAE